MAARRYRFRPSHRRLVTAAVELGRDAPRACDAVVVLTHAHPERVVAAAELADELGCTLVVLGTGGWAPRPGALVDDGVLRVPVISQVVDLLWPAAWPLKDLKTLARVENSGMKYQDIAAKRTLGLALARMLRWRRVLFVDDDRLDLDASQVRAACELVGPRGVPLVVGWHCEEFPDNSVVCHARRMTGLPQDTFFGAGVMLLQTEGHLPFFPPVYNEDWMHLFEVLHDGGALHMAGAVRQRPFDPFATYNRAYEEEFGDTLAEGMFHLIHERLPVSTATVEPFWAEVVEDRLAMIQYLRRRTARLLDKAASGEARGWFDILGSLDAAERWHREHPMVPQLSAFVRDWLADRAAWRDWLAALPHVGSVAEALDHLGVERAVRRREGPPQGR